MEQSALIDRSKALPIPAQLLGRLIDSGDKAIIPPEEDTAYRATVTRVKRGRRVELDGLVASVAGRVDRTAILCVPVRVPIAFRMTRMSFRRS